MDKGMESAAFAGMAMNRALTWGERMDMAMQSIKLKEEIIDYLREELMQLKGPCSVDDCRLHYAHNGPCWI